MSTTVVDIIAEEESRNERKLMRIKSSRKLEMKVR
jgi:hypothetical protein